MNPITAIKKYIYLLQAENYHLRRVLRVSLSGKKISNPEIVWTPKLVVVVILAIGLCLSATYFIASPFTNWLVFILLLYIFSLIFTVFLLGATILLLPIDTPIKKFLLLRAKHKIQKLRPRLKIIGITGSFGKTTTKEVISSVLSQKLRVAKSPENHNTPLGISRFILNDLDEKTDVLVVEMGAYKKGDVKTLCNLVSPDIAVITGINESHLERFGSLENTVRTKLEILEGLDPSKLVVLNADSGLVVKNYKRFFQGTPMLYSSGENPLASSSATRVDFDPKTLRLNLIITSLDEKYSFSLPFLGKYITGTIGAAIIVAKNLGLDKEQIKRGVESLTPAPHRLEVVSNKNGVVVIDDSYNGNPDGVKAAIEALSQFEKYRRIYVTPGLVEMGKDSKAVHLKIGSQLTSVADLVILIRNSVTGYIAEGLRAKGFSENDIMWFDSSKAARNALPNIIKTGDVILFQNDWPENYF